MDIISQYPDHLLLRILSFNPIKDVIVTSLLSKRWRSLWRLLPKLEYDCKSQHKGFAQFVYRSLLKNKAPVLLRLDLKNLKLDSECSAVDIGLWIDIAVSRRLRELEISIHSSMEGTFSLPSSLYSCKTLESFTLTIKDCFLVDVPLAVCLPFLKKLNLRCFGCAENASLLRLIFGCPNLEELSLTRPDDYGNYMKHKAGHTVDYTIVTPSLNRWIFFDKMFGKDSRYVINAPSLKYFCIISDLCLFHSHRIEIKPDFVMARIASTKGVRHQSLKRLTRGRRIYLCLSLPEVMDPSGLIFPHLVDLKICTCTQGWWDLLTHMPQDSPNLRFLKLTNEHCPRRASLETPDSWKRPSCVPVCLLSSLEVFKWTGYKGRQGDKEVATYVMRNASGLKRTIFSSDSSALKDKFQMLKELASVPMPSPLCLVFDHFTLKMRDLVDS